MPAPSSGALSSGILAALPPHIFVKQTDYLVRWVNAISSGTSQAWSQWHSGLTGAKASVTGVGIGGWAGTGTGGKLTQGQPFLTSIIPPFERTTEPLQMLIDAIHAELEMQFTRYASSFSFGPLPFVGTSTATPTSSGSFSANLTPGPLAGYKASATTPNSIATGIKSRLPEPPYDFSSGASVILEFLQAVETSILDQFTIWEMSVFSGDSVSGSASAAVGAGSGTSTGSGTLA